jgi:DNA-binding GntR family transcriptional regulator
VTALPHLIAQHRAIIEAVDARDADRAEAALKAHLSEILKALPTVQAAHRDLFI